MATQVRPTERSSVDREIWARELLSDTRDECSSRALRARPDRRDNGQRGGWVGWPAVVSAIIILGSQLLYEFRI